MIFGMQYAEGRKYLYMAVSIFIHLKATDYPATSITDVMWSLV